MAKKNIPYDQKYYDPEIECMPRPELEKLQLERLQAMVKYAYENTVYYKLSLIHISEPTRPPLISRMPSSA